MQRLLKINMNQSVSFGERLREERTKLDLTQSEFGALAGVTKKTQMLYEADARAPDSNYMKAISGKGVDVQYVITGTRSGTYASLAQVRAAQGRAMPPEGSLSRRAAALVANYEAADESGKKIIEGTASMAAQPKPSLQAGANSHQYVGDHGIQIGGAAGAVSINKPKGKK